MSEAIDWVKGALSSVFDPEKRNKEKEAIYMKECEPLTKKLYELCKSNGFDAIISINFGDKTHLAQVNDGKDLMISSVHEFFKLRSLISQKGKNSIEYKMGASLVVKLLEKALHQIGEKK